MTKIIAIANQKGGVGKTTTAGAMAANLKRRGFRVLAIDLDPQANLTSSVGLSTEIGAGWPTAYFALKKEIAARETIQHLNAFDLIPANITLANADQEFTMSGREYRLKEAIASIVADYDMIIIDTPPSLGILTCNAFAAAKEIIIPATASMFAIEGIVRLHETIKAVKQYCNPDLQIKGILITKYDPRTIAGRTVKGFAERIGEGLAIPIFQTFIRGGISVEEAQIQREDIFAYNEKTNPAQDYDNYVSEYLKGSDNYGQ